MCGVSGRGVGRRLWVYNGSVGGCWGVWGGYTGGQGIGYGFVVCSWVVTAV